MIQKYLSGDLYMHIDLTQGDNGSLAQVAESIESLFGSPKVSASDIFMATLDDFLGALYALSFAKSNAPPFDNRSGPIEVQVVVKRAEQFKKGTVRLSGKWLAGFHFNSALFRIAAAYHRGLKIIAGRATEKNVWKKDLLPLVKAQFPNWSHTELDHVYEEVNQLKHDANGIFQGRNVSWGQAIGSIKELIELFRMWAV